MVRRWQTYGVDAAGQVTHAGTHDGRRMDEHAARRLQRKWLTWRALYLRDNLSAAGSPLAVDSTNPARKTVWLYAHLIGEPVESGQYFPVA